MFSTSQGFPLGGFIRTLLWLSAVGVLALIGGAITLIVWLFTHVRIAA